MPTVSNPDFSLSFPPSCTFSPPTDASLLLVCATVSHYYRRCIASVRIYPIFSTAGVSRGTVTAKVTTIKTDQTTYHIFELAVAEMADVWPESDQRDRAWFTYADALSNLEWNEPLRNGLEKWHASAAASSP